MPAPDCAAIFVLDPPAADAKPREQVTVRVDGVRVTQVPPASADGDMRFPLQTCGVHSVTVQWASAPAESMLVAFAPDDRVVIPYHWEVSLPVLGGTRCLTLDPPTFGWSYSGTAIAPDAPFDLHRFAGRPTELEAEAKNQAPLVATLLPVALGHYTASVKDGAIAIAWEADTTACAGMK